MARKRGAREVEVVTESNGGIGGQRKREEAGSVVFEEGGGRGVRVLWGNVGGRSLGSRAGHSRSRAACSLLSFGPGTTARALPLRAIRDSADTDE